MDILTPRGPAALETTTTPAGTEAAAIPSPARPAEHEIEYEDAEFEPTIVRGRE